MSCALHKIQNLTQSVECSVSQAADTALTSWCGEGFFFLSQLSVQTLLQHLCCSCMQLPGLTLVSMAHLEPQAPAAAPLFGHKKTWHRLGTFRTPSTSRRAIVWTQENMARTRHSDAVFRKVTLYAQQNTTLKSCELCSTKYNTKVLCAIEFTVYA